MMSRADYRDIGALLHWGLNVDAQPGREPEYAQLLRRAINEGEFRNALTEVALGLGLVVMSIDERGLVLAPEESSVFRVRLSDYRKPKSADDRLLEGFIHVGIAAAIYPRAELLEESWRRGPITVDDVEEVLRRVCDELEKRAEGEPDPATDDIRAGLIAGWRLYQDRAAEGPFTQRVGASTKVMIERAFNTLVEAGMFVRRTLQQTEAFQPTFRYQVQVSEFAANQAFRMIQELLENEEAANA